RRAVRPATGPGSGRVRRGAAARGPAALRYPVDGDDPAGGPADVGTAGRDAAAADLSCRIAHSVIDTLRKVRAAVQNAIRHPLRPPGEIDGARRPGVPRRCPAHPPDGLPGPPP